MHFFELSLSRFCEPLLPVISERAFNRIDFPDPVSPVTVVKPERKSISRLSINVKFIVLKY